MFDINAIINNAIATAVQQAVSDALAPIYLRLNALDKKLEEQLRNTVQPDITVPISSSVANMPEVPIVSYVQGLEVRISKLTNEVEQLQERSADDESDRINKMKSALEDLIMDEVESQLSNLDLDEQVKEAISDIDLDYVIDFDQKISDALENADIEGKIEEALSGKDYVNNEDLSEAIQSEVREMFSNARITF